MGPLLSSPCSNGEAAGPSSLVTSQPGKTHSHSPECGLHLTLTVSGTCKGHFELARREVDALLQHEVKEPGVPLGVGIQLGRRSVRYLGSGVLEEIEAEDGAGLSDLNGIPELSATSPMPAASLRVVLSMAAKTPGSSRALSVARPAAVARGLPDRVPAW